MTSLATNIPVPLSLIPTSCPNCGYSLIGLADDHPCPECARIRDPAEIVLRGWGRGKHERITTAKPSRLIWVASPGPLVFGVGLLAFLFVHHLIQGLVAILGVVFILSGSLEWLLRDGHAESGLIQVRLSNDGIAQIDDLSGPTTLRTLRTWFGWLLVLIAAVALVFVAYSRKVDWVFAFFGVMNLIGVSVREGRTLLRYQKHRRQVQEGAIADLNNVIVPLLPWRKVKSFELERLTDKTQRLKVEKTKWIFDETPVDAEILCTSDQAAELRQAIHQYLDAARGK